MHQLLAPAAFLLQAAPLPPETFWPQTLANWAQTASGVAVVVGGIWALRNYFQTQRLKAAEILMKVEEEFRVILPTYEMIDISTAYTKNVEPALNRLYLNQPPAEDDLTVLTNLDRCLRFFVFCAVLNKDLGVEGNALLRSYYYHMALLAEISDPDADADDEAGTRARERTLLAWYLKEYYPRLCKWVKANRENLIRFRRGEDWEGGVRTVLHRIRARLKSPRGGRKPVSAAAAGNRAPAEQKKP